MSTSSISDPTDASLHYAVREDLPADLPHLTKGRHSSSSQKAFTDHLIHDNDSIFSSELDRKIADLGIHVLRTPFRVPVSNCYCEQLVGTFR